MTEISFPVRGTFLLSPRTANYIAALFREGDKFDYSKWLRRVREEETQAKQGLATPISKDPVAAEIGNKIGTSDAVSDDQSHANSESVLASSARARKQNATNPHSASP